MENKRVLVSLTVIRDGWKNKLDEINKYKIEEIALFPTTLDLESRKELYIGLERSCVKKIPHVHLRHDMELWELDYFINKFDTQVFNIHPERAFKLVNNLSRYSDKIFVENAPVPRSEEVERFGGLCIDFAHWEDYVKKQGSDYDRNYDSVLKLIEKFKIGCCHVSAMQEVLHKDPGVIGRMEYSNHFMYNLKDLDYMKKYVNFLPEFISLELENSIEEQLKAKEYLEKIIN